MTQCDMVLAYIKQHGSITALEADEALGVRRLADRINDLRDLGQDITSEMVTVVNRRGEDCRVAKYSMAGGQARRLLVDAKERVTPAPAGLLFDDSEFVDRWRW